MASEYQCIDVHITKYNSHPTAKPMTNLSQYIKKCMSSNLHVAQEWTVFYYRPVISYTIFQG